MVAVMSCACQETSAPVTRISHIRGSGEGYQDMLPAIASCNGVWRGRTQKTRLQEAGEGPISGALANFAGK